MVLSHIVRALVCLAIGWCCSSGAFAEEQYTFDSLFSKLEKYGISPNEGDAIVEKLKTLQPTFTTDQNERFELYHAFSLGAKGKHEDRIALVESIIGQVKTPVRRARFLYELIDANTALGRYERALQAMNESIVLLPAMEKTSQKIVVLQGALNLLNSLRAYDEALEFAERIFALRGGTTGSYAACVGLVNKVETNYMRGSNATARTIVPDAILACDANKNQFFSLIVKTYAAIDVIDSGDHTKGIATSLPLLKEFSLLSKDSDYLTQLEEALARAYLKTGNTERAEHYGLKAYQRAQSSRILASQSKTSETMAAIKRTQGQLAAAIGYYDINLDLKKKVLDDLLHKNLAFQRVKFDTQDKANQMALLEQKNKNLSTERALQQNEHQNLILLLTLGAVALAILGAWLYNTLRMKNIFRVSAQVDGLTQVSNRSHFTAASHRAFNDPTRNVSLVLFDMDFFKKINDTYGHAAGDWVLKTVCATVMPQVPKTALLGRLGGEEFALCLPNVQHEDEARALAERCRTAIAAINTAPSGFDFAITASFGVATRSAHLTESFEETLVQADKALYLSKNEGRNRVTVYQPSGTHSQ